MKFIISIMLIIGSLNGVFNAVHAEETAGEKLEVKSKKVKRSVKRGVNRIKEEACLKGKVKCLTIKGGHKIEEDTESIKDTTKDTINKID